MSSARQAIVAKGYQEFSQHFPKPGWVEHAPEAIWQATIEPTREVLGKVDAAELKAVGITNQRETVLLWDRETLGSPRRAIVWQDRRTAGDWSEELCALFGVLLGALPEIVPSWGEIGSTDPATFCGLELPIAGIAGDQQSALFGQTCFDPGDSKCTYGTGSFILTNTGTTIERSDAGLLSTAAWRGPDGTLTYMRTRAPSS